MFRLTNIYIYIICFDQPNWVSDNLKAPTNHEQIRLCVTHFSFAMREFKVCVYTYHNIHIYTSDPYDVVSIQIIFRKRALYIFAHVRPVCK